MTEAEWLAATDPTPMLEYLQKAHRATERKLRLFAVACVRRIWHLIPDGGRAAIEAAERFADGQSDRGDLLAEQDRAWPFVWNNADTVACAAQSAAASCAALHGFKAARLQLAHVLNTGAGPWRGEFTAQAVLLREVVADPFRPVPAVDPAWPAWQGDTPARLAQAAYDERHLPEGTLDPTRLALLGDALQDAGCTDPDLLRHLRGPGPHVKGCWALDIVLGKE
jgi:hypothetical protein